MRSYLKSVIHWLWVLRQIGFFICIMETIIIGFCEDLIVNKYKELRKVPDSALINTIVYIKIM